MTKYLQCPRCRVTFHPSQALLRCQTCDCILTEARDEVQIEQEYLSFDISEVDEEEDYCYGGV